MAVFENIIKMVCKTHKSEFYGKNDTILIDYNYLKYFENRR